MHFGCHVELRETSLNRGLALPQVCRTLHNCRRNDGFGGLVFGVCKSLILWDLCRSCRWHRTCIDYSSARLCNACISYSIVWHMYCSAYTYVWYGSCCVTYMYYICVIVTLLYYIDVIVTYLYGMSLAIPPYTNIVRYHHYKIVSGHQESTPEVNFYTEKI